MKKSTLHFQISFCLYVVAILQLHAQNLAAFQLPLKLQHEKKIEIPFQFQNNFILINLTFENRFSLRFIFDTGAEHTMLLKKNYVTDANIPLQRDINLMGSDLQTQLKAHIARRCQFQIGDIKFKRDVLVLEKDYLEIEKNIGTNVDGILGIELFIGFQLQIDYLQQKIIATAAEAAQPPNGKNWQKIPLQIIKNKPYLFLNLKAHPAHQPQKIKLLMDTGASLALMLQLTHNAPIEMPRQTIRAHLGTGLGGNINGVVGRTAQIQLGNHQFQGVPTHFQDLRHLDSVQFLSGRNGILGNEILSRFVVVLDFAHSCLYLKPNRKFKTQFEYDRSGISLVANGKNLDQFMIVSILPDSPADDADLRRGDQILRIGKFSTKWFSLERIGQKLSARAGKMVKIRIQRDGKIIEKVIILRDLI